MASMRQPKHAQNDKWTVILPRGQHDDHFISAHQEFMQRLASPSVKSFVVGFQRQSTAMALQLFHPGLTIE